MIKKTTSTFNKNIGFIASIPQKYDTIHVKHTTCDAKIVHVFCAITLVRLGSVSLC
jgi:hypothetical protein